MEYTKEILVKDYYDIHAFYANKYGENKTIILMQVGSFHECYNYTENNKEYGPNLIKLSEELDVVCTKKNGSLPMSKSNPRMMGFPITVTNNYIDKLISLNFTIVLIDQTNDVNDKNIKREITAIYSPSTYIESKNTKNFFLVSLIIFKSFDNKLNQEKVCFGISCYDLSTGEGTIYETYSKNHDIMSGLDDILRFLENYPPKEIIINTNIKENDKVTNMTLSDILLYLNIKDNVFNSDNLQNSKLHHKISYQKQLFETIYKIENDIDIFEYLGLQFLNYARHSLVLLLDYAKSHQPRLLNNLSIPILFDNNKYLYLGNRALEQLDIINNSTNLFTILNKTKTVVGKKFLHEQLTSPLINVKELSNRYNAIEMILKNNYSDKISSYLLGICNIDKLIRKLEIQILNPSELYQLYMSYIQINKLVNYLIENKIDSYFNIKLESNNKLNEYINYIENTFDIEKLQSINFNNFIETDISFYNTNKYNDIDNIINKITTSQNFMSYLITVLEKYIDNKKIISNCNKFQNNTINLKFNTIELHYLLVTKRRAEVLKKNLMLLENKNLDINGIIINIDDLEFVDLPKSNNTKILCKKVKDISSELVIYKIELAKLLKKHFKNDINYIYTNYNNDIKILSKNVAYIDFINSGAIVSKNNNYSKPIIYDMDYSYFKATEIRHPIIEKISNDTSFVPHNIMLGNNTEQNGILLYGINSSGKSTLMKSIGLNIVMAQIGYFVASKYFEYSPYKSLFTRICGNDNMFRGLSSFMVEMTELMAILKRNNSHTLVLADEVCRGTEIISANVIIIYMIETLIKNNCSFITASHFHNIANFESIKNLERLKIKHLKLTYDQKKDIIIYDRALTDGVGEESYGLYVARYIMKDKNFNERTTEILDNYNYNNIKQSRYNSNVYIECCEICKSKEKLETHHIVWQKDFKANKNKFHLMKNNPSNLVVLCMKCHDKVDRNEITINGWDKTSKGKILNINI
jgi:DNA mismatch repair protein MutS